MRKIYTRVGLALMLAGTLGLFGIVAAAADPPTGGPPGQDECDHGNSDNDECRPDPQPTHGQDCEEHGPFEGGVNEDHCLSTSSPPPTSSSPPPTSEPPTTTTEPPTTTTEPPRTTTEPPTTTAPPTTTEVPSGPPPGGETLTKDPKEPNEPKVVKAGGPGKLAFTGPEAVLPIGAAALALLTGGTGLLWAGRRKDDER